MYELSIKSGFSAGHHLEGYKGCCSAPHGHNWEVEVFVRGNEPDATGMLVDFRVLKDLLNAVLERLDHKNLNEVEYFRGRNPSSEHIARYIYESLSAGIRGGEWGISRVTVKETSSSSASYWE